MSVELRVLSAPGVAAGFGLAGLPTVEAATPEEAVARVRELLDHPEVGVILMPEDALRRLPDELQRRAARRPLPMLVPFPAAEWRPGPAVDSYIVDLLRRVIGYRVKLR